MKRRAAVRLSGYILAALAVMGGFIYSYYRTAEDYRLYIKNSHQQAFSELVSSVNDIDANLQKSLYATSPAILSSVLSEVYAKSTAAQLSLSELPFSSSELERTSTFIGMVGDYSIMLGKSAAAGNSFTDEQYESLRSLSSNTTLLAQNLTQLYADLENGIITLSELKNTENKLSESEDSALPQNLGASFLQMESEFPETPTLIYDGPFSQHITSMTPRLIENEPTISQEQALQVAADFCGVDKSNLSYLYERDTNPPVYAFSSNNNRDSYYIEITKQGGVVLNMMNNRNVDSSGLSKDDAVDIAHKFLSSKGYDSMQTSYVIQQQNVVTINFAYTQDDVICYTDLIKVSVALDRGQVVGFEALGYVMSHYERDIPAPEVDADTAQEKVSANLTVLSHALTVIPTDGKYELFCHEFKCENEDGQHYIVYINAITGKEERILILLEDENGTLTI